LNRSLYSHHTIHDHVTHLKSGYHFNLLWANVKLVTTETQNQAKKFPSIHIWYRLIYSYFSFSLKCFHYPLVIIKTHLFNHRSFHKLRVINLLPHLPTFCMTSFLTCRFHLDLFFLWGLVYFYSLSTHSSRF